MYKVEVKFYYYRHGAQTLTRGSFTVGGKSESAIISHLMQQYGADKIELIEYSWL